MHSITRLSGKGLDLTIDEANHTHSGIMDWKVAPLSRPGNDLARVPMKDVPSGDTPRGGVWSPRSVDLRMGPPGRYGGHSLMGGGTRGIETS